MYRENSLLKELKRDFDADKISLESLAADNNDVLSFDEREAKLLTSFGFSKHTLYSWFKEPITVYIRNAAASTEVLAARNLADLADHRAHLYEVPHTEVDDAQAWYAFMPLREKKHFDLIKIYTFTAAITFGAPGAILLNNFLGLSMGIIAGAGAYHLAKINLGTFLQPYTLASGAEALRCISNRASFEEYLKYSRSGSEPEKAEQDKLERGER